MNQQIKERWIKALRSGDYHQGKFALKKGFESVEHCCLGVLCELYAEDNPSSKWESPKYRNEWSFVGNHDGVATYLPIEVIEYGGLSRDVERELSQINDAPTSSFEQVADFIEKEL